VRPKRSLGQNFLVDPNLRRKIVEQVRVAPGETVLEIGPGQGALTEGLARSVGETGGRLILVELDDDLASLLKERFQDRPYVEVIHASILDLPLAEIVSHPCALRVVGNIPYNITSPILFHLLRSPRPHEILLMVQKEVGDRLLSNPGSGEYGALTVGVRSLASVERVLHVPATVFRPRPRVDSSVLRLRPFHPSPLTPEQEVRLRILTRSLFQWRRKQLGKILRDHPDLHLDAAEAEQLLAAGGATPMDRPETIAPQGFVAMAKVLQR
jgi:16S rRNA (adenine1518-N6/adenine1519-N6)-dimethyltransferase